MPEVAEGVIKAGMELEVVEARACRDKVVSVEAASEEAGVRLKLQASVGYASLEETYSMSERQLREELSREAEVCRVTAESRAADRA